MAVKSIVQIDVQDDSFKAFQGLFDRYQEALKTLPGEWGKVAAGTAGAGAAFDKMVEKATAMRAQSELEALAAKKSAELWEKTAKAKKGMFDNIGDMKSWGDATMKVASNWKSVAGSVKDASAGIASMTLNIAKWAGGAAFFSLLGAGGGLFGIDRLASSAASGRRSSMGLGISYGQEQAFRTNYGPYVNPDQLLGSVSTGKAELGSEQHTGLITSGLSQQFINTHNAAEISSELVKKLREGLKGVPEQQQGDILRAKHLDQFFSIEDARRVLSMSDKDVQGVQDRFRSDSKDMDVSPAVSKGWTEFTQQLTRAGAKIETVFITGLAPLEKPLAELSGSFADLVAAFLKSKAVGDGIDSMASGLESFAKYVGTDSFKEDVKDFASAIGSLARAVRSALEWLGIIPGKKTDSAPTADPTGNDMLMRAGTRGHPFDDSSGNAGRVRSKLDAFRRGDVGRLVTGGVSVNTKLSDLTPDQQKQFDAALAQSEGGPGSLADRNNNPGNLKFAGQNGAVMGEGGFAKFPTKEAGLAAMHRQIFGSSLYAGMTINQAMALYTSGDNSPGAAGKAALIAGRITPVGGGAAGSGDPAGIALGMQGYGEADSAKALGHIMHAGEWCADFVDGIIKKSGGQGTGSAAASSFANWGKAVGIAEIHRNDVILENAHGNRINHVGIATGEVKRDKNGNIIAVGMVSGNYGGQVRTNWESPNIIAGLRRGNAPDHSKDYPFLNHRTPNITMYGGDNDAITNAHTKFNRAVEKLQNAPDSFKSGFDLYNGAAKRQTPDGAAPVPGRTSSADPRHHNLSLAKFQLKQKPSITVQNSSGANVFTSAGAAAYG